MKEGKKHPDADKWYRNMKEITGVDKFEATFGDWQRQFKCNGNWAIDCNEMGLEFPLTCSYPPCNTCYACLK